MSTQSSLAPIRINLFFSFLFLALVSRIPLSQFLGHVPNFTPMTAIALSTGAAFGRRWFSFVMVFLCIWSGDIILNKVHTHHWELFYPGCYWQYMAWFFVTLLGTTLYSHWRLPRLLIMTLISSILFFMVSNFGVWCSGFLYPMTFAGFCACYVAAIPFFKYSLLGDFFFALVFWGLLFRMGDPLLAKMNNQFS